MSEILNTVTINNIEMPIKEYKGQRVVTFADIDRVHERDAETAKYRFRDNKKHFIPDIDYYEITRNDVGADFTTTYGFSNKAPRGFLITESGYLMIVKSLTDDIAWDVQRQLVNSYFRVKNTTSANTDPHIPLTREELAAYMLYTERHTDTIEKMMSSFIDNQTAVQNNTYNSMIQIITGFAESATATMNTMRSIAESMKSTMDSMATLPSANNDVLPEQNVCIDDERWKQSAYDKVNQIAKIIGNTSGNAVLIKIYNLIKINDGIDLAKYKKDYMRDNNIATISIISMIATNKELRKLFEKHADNYFEDVMSKKPSVIQSEKEEESKKKPISAIALKVPDSIIAEISPLAEKYDRSINSVFRPVYKEMELQSGLNLDNICTLYAEKLHISNVCKGYAISQDDQLMQIFRKAIKSLMERGLAK